MSEEQCIFCKIIRNEIASHKVYENDLVIAIMDIRQAIPGHVLVIPKKHITLIYDLDHRTGAEVMKSLIDLSVSVKDAFKAEGLSIWQSNGECAGQEIPHLHFHIHPRKPHDRLLQFYQERPANVQNAELHEFSERIKKALSLKNEAGL